MWDWVEICIAYIDLIYISVCVWVLRRVRQLEKKLMITDGRLPPVRDVLSHLSAKLSDTQGSLQRAASTIQETDNKNKANILKFQRNKVISHDPQFPVKCSALSFLSPPLVLSQWMSQNECIGPDLKLSSLQWRSVLAWSSSTKFCLHYLSQYFK